MLAAQAGEVGQQNVKNKIRAQRIGLRLRLVHRNAAAAAGAERNQNHGQRQNNGAVG